MIKNLILVALRTIKKDKAYSVLNILGLTIGISFSLLLILYVLDELSYDRYHEKADRIYRIVAFVNEPENSMKWISTQFPLGPVIKKENPEVEQSVRFVKADKAMYKNGELAFYEDKIFYADSNVFDVFTYTIVEGNPKSALQETHSMVLTQTLAEKYFGKGKPAVGKTLQNNHGDIYKITGVVKDPPRNSHFRFNALISTSTLPKDFANNWGGFGFFTYVLLKPNVNAPVFEKKLLYMYDKYMASIFRQFNIKIHYGVQPITAIHLQSDFNGPEEPGSMSYIYIFSAVALFMLIIACINYMNLTSARSARRAKEIGIRKVAGSARSQLIAQFLVESTVMALLALLLSLLLIALLLPAFNSIAGKFISFKTLLHPGTIGILLGIFVFVGLAGGSYPAFYLSKFNPVTVLKGKLAKSSSNTVLRKSLVTIQFTISIVMLICTTVVYRQLAYMRNKDLGFNKAQVINIVADADKNTREPLNAFKTEIGKNPSVITVSTGETTPGGNGISFNLFSIPTRNGYVEKGVDCYDIDANYLQTLGMKLVEGRNFSLPADTLRSILVNEYMVQSYGWKTPIGQRIKFPGDTTGRYLEVIGVVKDFNLKSLYNPIAPLILFYRPNNNSVQIKVAQQNTVATISQIEKVWKSILPALPFQYSFLDQDLDSQYTADQKRGKIFAAFSSLTIFITCLGLLGLIAFTTQQRQKEISIRKIMGAGIPHLVGLIAKNFLLLVGLSALIAFPLAWYFMNKWLNVFPYKSALNATPFLISAAVVLLITALTVGFHTVRAAMANPSGNLRTE
ncbi:MAG TPA: ABC transporter permease [Puia sp.]|nr:ABC transporter permease [Puia sp.]